VGNGMDFNDETLQIEDRISPAAPDFSSASGC
jgi:hypothetical protein